MTLKDEKRNIVLRVEPDFFQAIKIHTVKKNTTLQTYITELIKNDLQWNEKDKKEGK